MAELYRRDGSPFFYARIRVGGQRRRLSTGKTDRREAQKFADSLENESNARLAHAAELRLSQATERFLLQRPLREATKRNYLISFRNIVRVMGDAPLSRIQHEDLRRYVFIRKEKTGDPTILRDLAFLSSLFTAACNWPDEFNPPRTNPVKSFSRVGILKESQPRNRWLTEEEAQRLLEACTTPFQHAIVVLLLDTGMRSGEVFGLDWSECDMVNKEITLSAERTKNHTSRVVPMTQRVFDTLSRTLPADRSGPVFPGKKADGTALTTFKKSWAGIIKRANLPGLRIHDLRHTFASYGLQRGVPEKVVQDLMGHKTSSMTRRYTHSSSATRRAAIAQMEGAQNQTQDQLT